MSEKLNEITNGSFLRVNEQGKAYWGQSEGGGSADWSVNDPKAPGYVKNRPFYESDPVKTVLVPETTLNYTETTSLTDPFTFKPVDGEIYTVIYDGISYECRASTVSGSEMSIVIVGNAAAMGGEDTGEPFAIVEYMGTIMTMNTSGAEGSSHTISIEGYKKEVTPIPIQFLPTSVVNASLTYDDNEGFVVSCSSTYSEIFDLLNSGVNVLMRLVNTAGYQGYLMPMIGAFGGIFFTGIIGVYSTVVREYVTIGVYEDRITYELTPIKTESCHTKDIWLHADYEENANFPRIVFNVYTDENSNYAQATIGFSDDKKSLSISGEGIVIRSNSKYYRIGVDSSGNVTATEVTG